MFHLGTAIQKKCEIAARLECSVLITGPTGSGKTSLARWIHGLSVRRERPFVEINLASVHEGTLESELFGHEKGSFTGADQRRIGRLELAEGGTVLLDEIGDLSPRLQARLLEFLQTKSFYPVGSNRMVKVDVRVIAATHQPLQKLIEIGSFRADLYHRLRGLSIEMPSLQSRGSDFDEIFHKILSDIALGRKKKILRIEREAADRVEAYSWPGNFRELRHALEYAVECSDGEVIREKDLPEWLITASEVAVVARPIQASQAPLGTLSMSLDYDYEKTCMEFERVYLERALLRFGGQVSRTSRRMRINKTTLLRRIRAHQIDLDLLLARGAQQQSTATSLISG